MIVTIPFALLSAVVWLWAAGQTINIMTLGGLALAVGLLVDEATVEIENIHSILDEAHGSGMSRAKAVVEACRKTGAAIERAITFAENHSTPGRSGPYRSHVARRKNRAVVCGGSRQQHHRGDRHQRGKRIHTIPNLREP